MKVCILLERETSLPVLFRVVEAIKRATESSEVESTKETDPVTGEDFLVLNFKES